MIIIRYLVRETLKSQAAILFILLLIFFCQKLVRVLEAVVSGDIPANLIFSFLGLGVPEMAQLILPLSLFLAVLMTYGKLYAESEITVMHACGFGKGGLLQAALVLALLTSLLAAGNAFWLAPWSAQKQDQLMAEAKANPNLASLMEGQFQTSKDGNSVLFIGDVEGNRFHQIFLAQANGNGSQRPSVVVSDNGRIQRHEDGSQTVFLDTGTRYEGTALLRDFRITRFEGYQANMGYQSVQLDDKGDVERASMRSLWRDDSRQANAELHWRLTLVASVVIMALMVVPLSEVNPRQGRVLSMLPAILLYLIYFLLQSSFRSNGAKEKLDPMLWIWLTNILFLLLAFGLNAWNSLPVRRWRARLKGAK